MGTGKSFRSARFTAAAVLALCTAMASAVVPAPAHAADTVRGLQWYLDSLKIPQAHKITQGKGVVVAVIDSGVDPSHPDLRGQVLPGHGVNAAAAPDGRRDDDPESGHGTSMAGIIAGRGGSTTRELGIAPAAKILPVSMGPRAAGIDMVLAIRWAADAGADVINISYGGDPARPDPDLTDAVKYALGKDAVVVVSAGNVEEGDRQVTVPANIPGVIAVSGLNKRGGFFAGSVQGPEIVLAAPMESIIGPAPKAVSPNGYTVASGTSSAAAILSGVAALVRARYPNLDAVNVINRLVKTARDAGPAGRDPQFGFGAVDPLAALTRSVPAVTANPLLEGAAADPTRPGGGAARPGDDDGPAVEFGVSNRAGAIVQVGLCLAVPIVALVILLVVLRRRKRRARAAVGGPLPGPPGPPSGWPAGPPGWPTPAAQAPPQQPGPGYGPPAGQPAPGYPPPGYPPAQTTPGYPPPGQPAPGYPPAQAAPAPPTGGPGWPGAGPGHVPPPPGPQQQ
ncbi:type VII secretion-associated serine protease mycosin [Micromonospora coriariae]|uniref:Type VII secretion-associated serine protease mycosin n=1 Tax=Micromonospora coriariae TaxID=285665 RepID=A0A1C4VF26_9ACTN|nr:S8 family serine peptidase [Micromonospora coriariae]SCE82608.1 type VII secretion-associated serine protease mycosin [Micromonospora coriariae]